MARALVCLLPGLLWGCREVGGELRLDSVSPALACDAADGPWVLTVVGAGLGPVLADGLTDSPALRGPIVQLEARRDVAGATIEPVLLRLGDGDGRVRVASAEQLEIDVAPGLGLRPGVYDLRVELPGGSKAVLASALSILDAPGVVELSPDSVCHDVEQALVTVEGSGLLRSTSGAPLVTLDGAEVAVVDALDCSPLESQSDVDLCTGLELALPASTLAIGVRELEVRNRAPLDCGASPAVALELRPPPGIDAVDPPQVCDTGGLFTVEGRDFVEGMQAWVGGVEVDELRFVDSQTLELVLPADALPWGPADLELQTPDGCAALLEDALTVSLAPVTFAVDPPVLPVGLEAVVTAWVSDLFDEVGAVQLRDEAGEQREVAWTWSEEDPGRIEVTVPGDLAAGRWEILVEQAGDCPGMAGATIALLDELDLELDRVEPAFAWTHDYTPLAVHTVDPLDFGQPGLEAGARGWLVDPAGVQPAVRLLGPRQVDDTELAAVAPFGLPLGLYDLIVANPDGTAGHLPAAVEVTEAAPPRVDSLSPGTLPNSSDQALTLRGRDFRDPTVEVQCRDAGAEVVLAATVDSWTYSSVELTVPTTSLGQAVCVVAVQNDDGTSTRFSGFSVTNPSQNLFPWQPGTDLVQARRAPAAAAGRTTDVGRWVFAMGGDEGEESLPLDSIERARVGVYGDMGAWEMLGSTLPEPRTLAVVGVVGDFVYVVGGSDGAAAVDTTWRARILDPLAVPWIDGVSLAPGEQGLDAGRWTYRVSALFAPDDAANPGGESLATDALTMSLPDLDQPLVTTLRWTEVSGAIGYRVYRSPSAGAGAGNEGWVADTTEPSLADTGLAADTSRAPGLEGSLGNWARFDDLTTPRRSPCLAIAPDPFPDPETVYLYVAGGADADGELLTSIERLPVVVESDTVQTPGEWEMLEVELSEARERCGAMAVDSSWHSVVEPGDAWVYFAGGATGRGATGAVDAAWVEERGELVDMDTIHQMTPARAGFAAASASDFLYAFGGSQDGPSEGGASAELGRVPLPDVRNWNSLGTALSQPRWLPGSAQESAVMMVIGGQTETDDATTSTDWTNF